jgi:hypothetical protein
MPKVLFSLVDQFSDIRSKEVSYKFLIENHGNAPISVLAINPRIPDTVELIEAQNPSLQATTVQYQRTCHELEEILRAFLFVTVKEFRDSMAQANAEATVAMLHALPGTLGTYFRTLNRLSLYRTLDIVRVKLQSFALRIRNKADAVSVMETFMASVSDDDIVKKIALEKIRQLGTMEAASPADTSASALPIAIIEPDSFFAITYILQFPRSQANPKKYNLDVEAVYTEDGKTEKHVGGTTAAVVISPQPSILTLIAILAAILGAVVKLLSAKETVVFDQVTLTSLIGPAVLAGIVALIFFNVYEFTSFGDKMKMPLSWRSALLIGFLCGLLDDQMLAALKAFAGATGGSPGSH